MFKLAGAGVILAMVFNAVIIGALLYGVYSVLENPRVFAHEFGSAIHSFIEGVQGK